jgi:mediator of RNA polymerase II transcription subunit 12
VNLLIALITAAPPQSRPGLHAAFLSELSSTPVQAAFDRYPSLAFCLPKTTPTRRPILHKSDSDITPLDDRPWEFLEQLTPSSKSLKHVNQFLASRPIRDTASIPITLFKPQLKRDPIPRLDEEGYEASVAERNLGDGMAGEPLIAKQTSTLLFAQPIYHHRTSSSDDESEEKAVSSTPLTDFKSSPSIPAITPANRPQRAAARSTNLKTGSSTKDAIDLDSSSSSSSESDAEEVRPPAKRSRVGSKSTDRPTTSGKAPAKRTTGGKGVARKVTGGKNVGRKAPGKAPKKR